MNYSMNIPMKKGRLILIFFAIGFCSILFQSCADKVDETPSKLSGTWHQISKTVDGVEVAKDSIKMLLVIQEDHICVLYDSTDNSVKAKTVVSRSGWSYTGGYFNLAVDLPVAWTPEFSSNSLYLKKEEFTKVGKLSATVLHFEKLSGTINN